MDVLQLDAAARAWVVAHRLPWLDPVMWALSAIGRGGILSLILAAVISVKRRKPRAFVQVALAVALAAVLADHVLKPAIHRDRPFVTTPEVQVIGGKPHDASFPSGHASTAGAGALTLTLVAPALAPVWWALAIAVDYSRVYVGVHYPGDVIAGTIVGILAAIAVALIRRWLLEP